jgi:hypothetical protein
MFVLKLKVDISIIFLVQDWVLHHVEGGSVMPLVPKMQVNALLLSVSDAEY